MTLQTTSTATQLLCELHDPENASAWRAFDARYRPIVFALARRLGLGQEDAADVAQQALTEFVVAYRAGRYHRERGRLRSWVIAIAKHRAVDSLRRRGREAGWRGDSMLAQVPDDEVLEGVWDSELERHILGMAMQEFRDQDRLHAETWRAFELVALEGRPPAEVAEACGKSVAEIYRIKNRITRRLREIVDRIRPLYKEAPT
jgi:RNA polymerase sigma-70 factor (ECF subfamily)